MKKLRKSQLSYHVDVDHGPDHDVGRLFLNLAY